VALENSMIRMENAPKTKKYNVDFTLKKIDWQQDKLFVELAVDKNTPIIFKNTMAQTWKAMKAWTPEYVCKEMKYFESAYSHNLPLFGPYWDEERPLMRIHSIQRKNGHEIVNITTNAFLENMRHPKKDEYFYFSTNINKITKKLVAEIQPTEFLEVNPLSEKQNINFWIGMKGTTAHTHYDVFENFNVQVVGRKKNGHCFPLIQLYICIHFFIHLMHKHKPTSMTQIWRTFQNFQN